MKTIQLILSCLLASCAAGMFYGAIVKESLMKGMNITFTVILLLGSIILIWQTFKEYKNGND